MQAILHSSNFCHDKGEDDEGKVGQYVLVWLAGRQASQSYICDVMHETQQPTFVTGKV